MPKRMTGFTLYELLIALAIISVLSALSAPSFIKWLHDIKLKTAIISLKHDMEFVKSSAIKTNSLVVINFYENGYEIFSDSGENSGNWLLDDDEKLLKKVTLSDGVVVNLDKTTFRNERTRFKGNGTPSVLGTAVLIDKSGNMGKISLSRLGKITIKK